MEKSLLIIAQALLKYLILLLIINLSFRKNRLRDEALGIKQQHLTPYYNRMLFLSFSIWILL